MNTNGLLGILAMVYAGIVIGLTITKPPKIWQMKKIQGFVKLFGEKGTVIFFYIWAIGFACLGIWLLTR